MMLPVVLLLLVFGDSIVTNSVVNALQTNVGREFVFAYAENYQPIADPSVIVTNMSPLAHEIVTVNISTPVHGLLRTVRLQGFDSFEQLTLPRELVPYGEAHDLTAIIVRADDDIAVYAINDAHDRSMDGFTVLPIRSLGTEYFVASYAPSLNSQMVIVSTDAETTVRILLSNNVIYRYKEVHAGRVITIDTRKYEVVLLEGIYTADLTGTKIVSNKPIAVLSGNRCAFVPVDVLSCDHLAEMLPPLSQWGKTFVIMPFFGRATGAIYRVIAGKDRTEVVVKSQKIVLGEQQFQDFEVAFGQTSLVQSDKPVLVVQFAKGFAADNVNGDPSMTIIPPIEQSVSLVKLPTYNITKELKTVQNYVNIYASCKELYYSNITLDGILISDIVSTDRIVRVDRSDYCAVGLHLAHGIHTLAAGPKGLESFVAIAYGFAEMNSYAWPAGLGTRRLTCEYMFPDGGIRDYDCDKELLVVNIPCNTTEAAAFEGCLIADCIKYEDMIFICAGVAVLAIILQNLFSRYVMKRTKQRKKKEQLAFGQVGLHPPGITINESSPSPAISFIDIPTPSPLDQRRPSMTPKQERANRLRRNSCNN